MPRTTRSRATKREAAKRINKAPNQIIVLNETESVLHHLGDSGEPHEVISPHTYELSQTTNVEGEEEINIHIALPPSDKGATVDAENVIVTVSTSAGPSGVAIPQPRQRYLPSTNIPLELKDNKCHCGQQFEDIHGLIAHEKECCMKRTFRCSVCYNVFSRRYHLERHMKLTPCSGEAPPAHPCEFCGKVYTRKDNLNEHLRVHKGEESRRKKFKCDICSKLFQGESLLKTHIRCHTGEKPYVCEFCRKSFPSSGGLTKHRRTHTGDRPYTCAICNARFSLKGTLNRHHRTHTGVRPHVCNVCGKSFIQAGGLKAHMFHHDPTNGFKCEECDKTFNRKARLEMHKRFVHTKDRPHECKECSKKFTRKEDLNRHLVKHTGSKQFECLICLKRFAIKSTLRVHMLTHQKEEPQTCKICNSVFIRKDCLLRHVKQRHLESLEEITREVGPVTSFIRPDLMMTKFVPITDTTAQQEIHISEVSLTDEQLVGAIKELLTILVDDATLDGFGWPDAPLEDVLEAVIKRCGHTPVERDEKLTLYQRLRENSKLLFTTVIDDASVKALLDSQSLDEVILYVLELAKS